MIITTLFQKPVTTYAASVSYLILLSRGARSTVRQLRWPRQSTGSHNNSPVAAVYTARSTDGERERERVIQTSQNTHTPSHLWNIVKRRQQHVYFTLCRLLSASATLQGQTNTAAELLD